MQFNIYSTVELSNEIRSQFELYGDPYEDDRDGKESRAYMEALGIIFYRDEEHEKGLILGKDNYEDKFGFGAFHSHGEFEEDSWKIGVWENPPRKYLEKRGYPEIWLKWNKKVVINRVSEENVLLGGW